jgi:protein-S-isoprenylcysteine O-methyltransferase Ste14
MAGSSPSKSGLAALIYGVASYGLFLGVFVYAVGFIGGFATPTRIDGVPGRPLSQALAIDLGLLALFAVQHSVMARPGFKRWWTRFVPEAVERSTYVLLSSLAMVALFAWWEPIGGIVWDAPAGLARNSVIALYLLGWALLLYTTFLIDHFDLFGLRQVWNRLRGHRYEPPKFYTPSLYRIIRHPLYVGWLTIFWAAPTMTVAHLVFALGTTAYILIAIRLEERDLVAAFGDRYLAYRQATPMLVPRLVRRREPRAGQATVEPLA